MQKGYRPWNPTQSFLLPQSPLDWLPEGHLAFAMLDFVAAADLSVIEEAIDAKDARGNPPFHPRMMVALLFYGYCTGIASSRGIERATYMDVAFRVIAGGQHPDHTAISEFRRVHLSALAGLFLQVLRLCQKAGLVKLGHVALDGTKVKANASKHKAMSYERMLKKEGELKAEIEKLLAQAEQTDQTEDQRHGVGRRGDELPAELRRREDRLKKIQAAKAALEAEAAAARAGEVEDQAARARKNAEEADPDEKPKCERAVVRAEERVAQAVAKANEKAEERVRAATEAAEEAARTASTQADKRAAGRAADEKEAAEGDLEKLKSRLANKPSVDQAPSLPEHRVAADKNGDPTPKAQMNFTDRESRIMKAGGDFVQGYNCQAVVDDAHQIVVAHGASNQAPDPEHLPAMLAQVKSNCGASPSRLSADAGYWSEENADYCTANGIDAYIAVARQKHGDTPDASVEPTTTNAANAREAMRQKVSSEPGRAVYKLRKSVVEPVFGQTKEARGFRRFLLRGLDGASGEWSLITAGHNFLKLFRALAKAGKGLRVLLSRAPAALGPIGIP